MYGTALHRNPPMTQAEKEITLLDNFRGLETGIRMKVTYEHKYLTPKLAVGTQSGRADQQRPGLVKKS